MQKAEVANSAVELAGEALQRGQAPCRRADTVPPSAPKNVGAVAKAGWVKGRDRRMLRRLWQHARNPIRFSTDRPMPVQRSVVSEE